MGRRHMSKSQNEEEASLQPFLMRAMPNQYLPFTLLCLVGAGSLEEQYVGALCLAFLSSESDVFIVIFRHPPIEFTCS